MPDDAGFFQTTPEDAVVSHLWHQSYARQNPTEYAARYPERAWNSVPAGAWPSGAPVQQYAAGPTVGDASAPYYAEGEDAINRALLARQYGPRIREMMAAQGRSPADLDIARQRAADLAMMSSPEAQLLLAARQGIDTGDYSGMALLAVGMVAGPAVGAALRYAPRMTAGALGGAALAGLTGTAGEASDINDDPRVKALIARQQGELEAAKAAARVPPQPTLQSYTGDPVKDRRIKSDNAALMQKWRDDSAKAQTAAEGLDKKLSSISAGHTSELNTLLNTISSEELTKPYAARYPWAQTALDMAPVLSTALGVGWGKGATAAVRRGYNPIGAGLASLVLGGVGGFGEGALAQSYAMGRDLNQPRTSQTWQDAAAQLPQWLPETGPINRYNVGPILSDRAVRSGVNSAITGTLATLAGAHGILNARAEALAARNPLAAPGPAGNPLQVAPAAPADWIQRMAQPPAPVAAAPTPAAKWTGNETITKKGGKWRDERGRIAPKHMWPDED